MSLFEKLDPIVKSLNFNDFDNIAPLQKISQKIGMGCRPAHIVFISGIIIILLMVLELGSYLIGSVVGFAYPAYMSFKALESENTRDDRQWLTYWIVFSFLTVFDGVLSTILSFLPAYNFFKLVFYIYLFHPSTRGAESIYTNVLEKFFLLYESKIDELLKKGQSKLNSAVNQASKKIQ